MSRKPLNINTHSLVLTNFIPLLRPFGDGNEEVLYPFIINFEHGNMDFVLFVGVVICSDSIKNLFA